MSARCPKEKARWNYYLGWRKLLKNSKRYNSLVKRAWLNAKSQRVPLLFYNCRFVPDPVDESSYGKAVSEMVPVKSIDFDPLCDFLEVNLENGYRITSHLACLNPYTGIPEVDDAMTKIWKNRMIKYGNKISRG